MSFDFIEDASDVLAKTKYAYAIICGAPNNMTQRCWDIPDSDIEKMVTELRIMADQLESGELLEQAPLEDEDEKDGE